MCPQDIDDSGSSWHKQGHNSRMEKVVYSPKSNMAFLFLRATQVIERKSNVGHTKGSISDMGKTECSRHLVAGVKKEIGVNFMEYHVISKRCHNSYC